jgi:hypothetical protein
MPSGVPNSLDGWWCNADEEYAFLGFSYEVTACIYPSSFHFSSYSSFFCYRPGQSLSLLKKEFGDVRNRFNGRYIRLYGACDRQGF